MACCLCFCLGCEAMVIWLAEEPLFPWSLLWAVLCALCSTWSVSCIFPVRQKFSESVLEEITVWVNLPD